MSARSIAAAAAALALCALPLAQSAFSKTVVLSAPATTPVAELQALGRNVDGVVLADETGGKVKWGALKGRPRAVFFGFTRCPVICPVTLWEVEAALAKIGTEGDRIDVNFVSLDPKRDTPDVLKNYLSSFKGRVRGFTGSDKEVARLAKGYDVAHRKVPTSADDYTMDHTAAVFLIDANGKVVDTVAYGTPQDVLVTRLKTLAAAK
jgi:protein SCO1